MGELPTTGGDPTIITLQLGENRLTAGILSVHNEAGGGLQAFADFRGQARGLAQQLGVGELELQGQAVVNPRIEALLRRQGFETKTVDVPEDLGGGTVDVFFKVFSTR